MRPEQQQQQTWKITIQAKTKKSFKFKFKSTQIVPTWNHFHRFSILIKLRQVILRVKLNSESTASSVSRKRKSTLKSKLLRIFKNIEIPRTKKQEQTIKNPEPHLLRLKQHFYKEPISVATLCSGILVFLAQSIFSIVQKGFIFYSLPTLLLSLFFSIVSGKYSAGRILKLLVILMVAASTGSSMLDFSSCMKFCGRYVSDYIGRNASKFARLFL